MCTYQSMQNVNPRLAKINIYEDTSGSISLDQQISFNSELKFIKETFQPEQINVVLFDCEIHKEISIKEHDNFNKIEVIGGGGTSLVPVREHILKTKPSVAIVFSDLFCEEMEPVIGDTLIIWVILGNPDTTPKFGKSIHIKGMNMECTTQDLEIMVAKTLAPLQEPIYLTLQDISTTNVDIESTIKCWNYHSKFDVDGLRVINQNVGICLLYQTKTIWMAHTMSALLIEHAEK